MEDTVNHMTQWLICRWHIQRGVVCIPKSVTPSRIQQNLNVFDFSLSEEDTKSIESFNHNKRFIAPTVEVSHQVSLAPKNNSELLLPPEPKYLMFIYQSMNYCGLPLEKAHSWWFQ